MDAQSNLSRLRASAFRSFVSSLIFVRPTDTLLSSYSTRPAPSFLASTVLQNPTASNSAVQTGGQSASLPFFSPGHLQVLSSATMHQHHGPDARLHRRQRLITADTPVAGAPGVTTTTPALAVPAVTTTPAAPVAVTTTPPAVPAVTTTTPAAPGESPFAANGPARRRLRNARGAPINKR